MHSFVMTKISYFFIVLVIPCSKSYLCSQFIAKPTQVLWASSFLNDADSTRNELKHGDKVKVFISRFGPLGASVSINDDSAFGLVLRQEIMRFKKSRGGINVEVGETLDGYVEKVREDGKIDILLRPIGMARVLSLRDKILDALEGSPSGSIPLGDKSSPEDINSYFYGTSKNDFKNAIGVLFREGIARPGENSLTLMSEEESKEHLKLIASKSITNSKSVRKFSDRDISKSIFIGNLPFKIDEEILTKLINKRLDNPKENKVQNVRLVRDEDGNPKGYGYVEFLTEDLVEEALVKLKGVPVNGRAMRVDYADPAKKEVPPEILSGDVSDDDLASGTYNKPDGSKVWQSNRDRNRILSNLRSSQSSFNPLPTSNPRYDSRSTESPYKNRDEASSAKWRESRSGSGAVQAGGGGGERLSRGDGGNLRSFDREAARNPSQQSAGRGDDLEELLSDTDSLRSSVPGERRVSQWAQSAGQDSQSQAAGGQSRGTGGADLWEQQKRDYRGGSDRGSDSGRGVDRGREQGTRATWASPASGSSAGDRQDSERPQRESSWGQGQGRGSPDQASRAPRESYRRMPVDDSNRSDEYLSFANQNNANSRQRGTTSPTVGGMSGSREGTWDREASQRVDTRGRGQGEGNFRRKRFESTLFVGNIPYDITENEIKAEIEKFVGHECVASVRIAAEADTGRKRGFAYVDVINKDDADAIFGGMHGRMIGGRAVNIDDATRPSSG